MAAQYKQAAGFAALGLLGLAVAVSSAKNIYDSNVKRGKYQAYRDRINLHNALYAMDYHITSMNYGQKLGEAIAYVHAYRYGYTHQDERHEVLLSPLYLLKQHDVAILLAGAMAATHLFADFSDLFPEQNLIWNPAQSRYVTVADFVQGGMDDVKPTYTETELRALAKLMRKKINDHREYRVSKFMKEQAGSILRILQQQGVEEEDAA